MIPEIGDALTGSGPMSEDCLRLNVFTPGTNGPAAGDGVVPRRRAAHRIRQFHFYDGRELARQHDVVVVTTTHRLNAFAYLWLAGFRVRARGSRTAPTWDSATWCWRSNGCGQYRAFGGDAGNVTIFGQSGGGGKTAMLTGFPAARGCSIAPSS